MRVLRDAVARAVCINEGDSRIAWSVALDLEIDPRVAVTEWDGKR
jgi:hypothetical protein